MQPPKALRMPETEETTEEFVSAELEMLAMGAKSIPPSSSLGALFVGTLLHIARLCHSE